MFIYLAHEELKDELRLLPIIMCIINVENTFTLEGNLRTDAECL